MTLVSCICPTLPVRFPHLQRAIFNYCAQTYLHKELIIITHDPKHALRIQAFVNNNSQCANQNIKVILRPHTRQALDGLLQGLAVARGDYVALWDDDNLSAPTRLAVQMEGQLRLGQTGATVLAHAAYHYHDSNELFIVDFLSADPTAPAQQRCCSPSLIMARDMLPPLDATIRQYPSGQMVNYFASNFNTIKFNLLRTKELLFVAGIHFSGHIKPFDYYRQLSVTSKGTRTSVWLQENKETIVSMLSAFKWNSISVDVEGSDGHAFTYDVPTENYWISQNVDGIIKQEMADVVRENVELV